MNRCKDCGDVHNNVRMRPIGFPLVDQRGPYCVDCWNDKLMAVWQARKENA